MQRLFSAIRLLVVSVVALALVGASAVGLVAASASDTSSDAIAFL